MELGCRFGKHLPKLGLKQSNLKSKFTKRSLKGKYMELTTLFGLLLGVGGIILGNIAEGGQTGSLVQGAAAIIVFCGTAGAVIVSSRSEDLRMGLKMLRHAFFKSENSKADDVFKEIMECSRIARRESILSLETRIAKMPDLFFQNVMKSVVDGVDPKLIREIFEKQIDLEERKLLGGAKIWSDAGGYSPTIGIVGAVLGLIHVMGNLTDTSKLGGGIAVAFVATIYGVGAANLILLPIGNKLKKWVQQDILIREMIIEGGLCIQSGIAPALTEVKLKTFVEHGRNG
jgi:chemotaxis protein MotA